MEMLEEVRNCRHCDALINIKDEICTFCKLDTSYEIPLSLEKLTFKECSHLINEAFFKIEMFMNGNQKTYQYFGFNDHFTKLFQLVNEMKNYTHENWDLITGYWHIIYDIQYTVDKGIDVISIAHDEEYFNNDCNGLSTLLNYRIHEFSRFDNTPDYEYKRATILDLLENKPQQSESLLKNLRQEIFKNDFGYTLFYKMKGLFINTSTPQADYSFLFDIMKKEELIICTGRLFIKFLSEFSINIDKIDSSKTANNRKTILYNSIKEKYQ
jgi:hypothetical protein